MTEQLHFTIYIHAIVPDVKWGFNAGHGTADWFQVEKEVCQGLYCHLAYLMSMQSTSGEMLGWVKH